MSGLFLRPEKKNGYQEIVQDGDGGLEYLSFSLVRLQPGESYSDCVSEYESVLVLLEGACQLKDQEHDFGTHSRRSVFEEMATALFVPPGVHWSVTATGEAECLVAVGMALSDHHGECRLIKPEEVRMVERGKPGFRRTVHDIIDERTPAEMLVVGETFNQAGEWSSYPPHRHDNHNPPDECEMEEIYYFRVDPPQGFGFQRIYTEDRSRDESYAVEDGTVVIIPEGYHPVAAAPGYSLYYLWILAGQDRTLRPRDDPAHSWVGKD